jgi:hypothetical protein
VTGTRPGVPASPVWLRRCRQRGTLGAVRSRQLKPGT